MRVRSRVRAICAVDMNELTYNQTGTIIDRSKVNNTFLVEFNIDVHGHDGNNSDSVYNRQGKDGFCWWCSPEELELITPKHKPLSIKAVVLQKTKTLWNNSGYVLAHPDKAY